MARLAMAGVLSLSLAALTACSDTADIDTGNAAVKASNALVPASDNTEQQVDPNAPLGVRLANSTNVAKQKAENPDNYGLSRTQTAGQRADSAPAQKTGPARIVGVMLGGDGRRLTFKTRNLRYGTSYLLTTTLSLSDQFNADNPIRFTTKPNPNNGASSGGSSSGGTSSGGSSSGGTSSGGTSSGGTSSGGSSSGGTRSGGGGDLPTAPGFSPVAQLGNYVVSRNGSQLRIRRYGGAASQKSASRDEPGPGLWTTTAQPVSLARTKLDVNEHRALYDITENTSERCDGGTFGKAAGSSTANDLVFKGHFTSKACQDVTFTLRLTNKNGKVGFKLESDDADYNHVVLNFVEPENTQYYGFGEQTEPNLRGRNIPIISEEQGVGRGGTVSSAINALAALKPDAVASFKGEQGSPVTTYYTVPQTITSGGAGMLLENTGYTRFNLKEKGPMVVNGFAGLLTGRLYGSSDLLDTIQSTTQYTGRMPVLPHWTQQGAVLGLEGGTKTVRQRYQTLKKAGTPITALWLQDWGGERSSFGGFGLQTCWNWELDTGLYPNWDKLRSDLKADGVRLLGYFNPYLVADSKTCNPTAKRNLYKEAKTKGYLVKYKSGQPYQLTITDFDAGIVDLTNPQAFEWLKNIIETQVEKRGFSGWMADFGEGLPFDVTLANGKSGRVMHNRFPQLWTRLNREVVNDLKQTDGGPEKVFFRRSGFTRTPGYATLFWAGDQATVWDDKDGLQSAITSIINGGFSGMALNHSDIGGYTSLGIEVPAALGAILSSDQFKQFKVEMNGQLYASLHRSPELLERWTEFAAFTTMMRTHEGLSPEFNAQVYDSPAEAAKFARMVKVFEAFAPYREKLIQQAHDKGYPLIRHPVVYRDDDYFKNMTGKDIEFMLGKHVLIAPVVEPGKTSREVHLPQGQWTQLWSGKKFSVGAGGKTFVDSDAGIGKPPVYVDLDNPQVKSAVDSLKQSGVIGR